MKVHEITIDGITCLANRDSKNRPSYCQWEILEKQTGLSLMPSSWNPSLNAATLKDAKYLIQHEVIDKHGKNKIQQRITEILTERKTNETA